MSNWNADKTHKATNTLFSPAGYDINGLNEAGFNRWGYDSEGFKSNGKDKYGNYRGTGLVGYETRLLNTCVRWDEPFRKTDVVPGFFRDADKSSRDWHFGHSTSFDSLVDQGFIVKSGRRYVLSPAGQKKIDEVSKKEMCEEAGCNDKY